MGIMFNIEEVLAIAEEIERNGVAFYEKIASMYSGEISRFLLDLAAMERMHLLTFKQMRKEHKAAEYAEQFSDPFAEAILYLDSLAGGFGGEGDMTTANKFTGKESLREILLTAISLEEKSIILYTTLRDLVRSEEDKAVVTQIINEEKGHIVDLTGHLKELP
ncbi:MAG: ferritin family protein [Lentisphaerae bacterium]|nr:ferritin family protein [Lentisphaerota bacterium]